MQRSLFSLLLIGATGGGASYGIVNFLKQKKEESERIAPEKKELAQKPTVQNQGESTQDKSKAENITSHPEKSDKKVSLEEDKFQCTKVEEDNGMTRLSCTYKE